MIEDGFIARSRSNASGIATRSIIARATSVCLIVAAALSSVPAFAQSNSFTKHHPFDPRTAPELIEPPAVVRISPPQAGVKLVEEVFQRVRSSPQIAMAKSLQQQQQVQNIMKQSSPELAIRPQQTGKTALPPSPTLALLPRSGGLPPAIMGRMGRTVGDSQYGYSSAAGSPIAQSMPQAAAVSDEKQKVLAAADEAAPPPAAPVAETFLGNKQYPAGAGGGGGGAGAAANAPGLWEHSIAYKAQDKTRFYNAPREVQIVGEEKSLRKEDQDREFDDNDSLLAGKTMRQTANAAPNAYRPPDLATATGKLANLLNNTNAVMQAQPSQSIAFDARRNGKDLESSFSLSTERGMPLSGVTEASLKRSVAKKASAKSARLTFARATPAAAPRAMPGDTLLSFGGRRRDNTLAMNDAGIALLPPNVVNGIPLVRLGIPEAQANSALNSMGTTRQERVDKWEVLSWQRRNSKEPTALQLYVRNGLLDAMRIFDPLLIAHDFGVNLGDSLSRVKEKFGEPAFILSEPGPGQGKNYIYPISQVGFQLTQSAPDQQPRVVSVLIFNVK